jgi:DNA-binding response OmpR family regulator
MRILIVEDEVKVAKALKQGFEDERYEAAAAFTGEDAFFRISTERFDVILLDIMLPGRNGFEILASIRKQGIATPVLLLTARDSVRDRVAGLDAGADDYVVKPFAFDELLARVRALGRRSGAAHAVRFSIANLDVDLLTRRVKRGGQTIDLTAREFDVLEYLIRHQQEVVTRDTIAREIWKEVAPGCPLNNVIDVHIARLRRKVDDAPHCKLIHTVRGVGFILSEKEP